MSISSIVARLNQEPLTHIMLGHRELFHSNLLAWFFRCLPDVADDVFGPLAGVVDLRLDEKRIVLREKNNLDLIFQWSNRRTLVIENKVFSLPDEEQLEAYSSIAGSIDESAVLYLLSLSNPGWLSGRKEIGGREWQWISYRDLAKRIRSSLASSDLTYEAETMRRYSLVVDLLSDLVDHVVVMDSDEMVHLPTDVNDALGDDRLASTMAKLRARSVAHRIQQALDVAGINIGTVKSSLTNALPLIEWFCKTSRAPGARTGWQLQGNQFRLALITPHLSGRTPSDRQARFDFAKWNEDLFNFAPLDQILGTEEVLAKPLPRPNNPLGFNRYDPDFVYRYKSTPLITVSQLENAAVAFAGHML
jgi:hypothetical protein